MNTAVGNRIRLAVASLLFVLFALVVTSHAATDGLCCGDDAAIALVAKNIAAGDGYSLPLNFLGESGHFPMHPGISSGPTVVLPAAMVMMLTGPEIWAPSAASSALSIALLLWMFVLVRRACAPGDASLFVIALLPALYVFTAGEYFVHWYALLGEAPAILLLALAAWFAAGSRGDDGRALRHALCAGLLAGLAINSKLLALIGALALGSYYVWQLLHRQRAALRKGLAYTAGMLLPPGLFELYRIALLGLAGYRRWLVEMRAFMSQQVPGPDAGGGIWDHLSSHVGGLGSAMGLTVLSLAVPLLVLMGLKFRAPESTRTATASLLALAAAGANLGWWLLFSNGWPRYALIGLALLAFSIAFAAISLPARRGMAFAIVVLFCLVPWHRPDRVAQPVSYTLQNGFVENERVTALRATAHYLDQPGLNSSVVAGYWWASLAALEYATSPSRRTVAFNRLYSADPRLPDTLLLANPQWDAMAKSASDPAFRALAEKCTEAVVVIPPFTLSRCRFGAGPGKPNQAKLPTSEQ